MNRINSLTFRRVTFINRFERACNFTLLHLFPLPLKDSNYYEALLYAKTSLANEKRSIKDIRRIMKEKGDNQLLINGLLSSAVANQDDRHRTMQKIIERK